MVVITEEKIKNMYEKYGITPPTDNDSFEIRLKRQSELTKLQIRLLRKMFMTTLPRY